MKIKHRKGSLFEARSKGGSSADLVLVHAVNSVGVWGAGIAAEFRGRFPWAYNQYKRDCITQGMVGRFEGYIATDAAGDHPIIGCLFTSGGFGSQLDPMLTILRQTESALKSLAAALPKEFEVHSNRFNSGLFGVPWHLTEALIADLDRPGVWTVWTP